MTCQAACITQLERHSVLGKTYHFEVTSVHVEDLASWVFHFQLAHQVLSARDINSCPPVQEYGAVTKGLARLLRLSESLQGSLQAPDILLVKNAL
jgi:hypothetical protein